MDKQLEEFVPIVTASKKDYYKYHLVDCNTDDEEVIKSLPFCSSEYRDKLPALVSHHFISDVHLT